MSPEEFDGIDPLESLIAKYLQAESCGQDPDRDVLIEEHPDLADPLREFFANHDRMKTAGDLDKPTLPATEGVTCPAGPSVGDKVRYFGDYELLEEIARGGMGVVFKARQVNLNRIVALKMILAGQFAGQEDVQRFYTEAKAAAQLDHPGIVPIFEIGKREGQHYFSMGYIEGMSLADKVAEGPLPSREAAELVKRLCDAMAYAHQQSVIHRDLKPANILIDKNGQPKVTDFGLAKNIEAGSNLTGTGQILGTPSYMAPEQASGKTNVGPLVDIYSLGAILYCSLTGRPPFQAASPLDTLLQVLHQEPVAPRLLNPQVPRDLETICLKCLRKEPLQRFTSANALAADLQRYLNGEPILARPTRSAERVWKWCKRNPRAVASAFSVVALLFIVGFVVSLERSQNRTRILAEKQRSAATIIAERQHSDDSRLRTMVASISSTKGIIHPPLSEFEVFPRASVLKEMQSHFMSSEEGRKLTLAIAMAQLGDVRVDFLVSQLERAMPDDAASFVAALAPANQEARPAIAARSLECDQQAKLNEYVKGYSENALSAWRYKARLAMLGLHLGDTSIAEDMCRTRPDPIQRTIFIDEGPAWCVDLSRLSRVANSIDGRELRASICAVIGGVLPELVTPDQKEAWQQILTDWYLHQPDAGTHSTSELVLRRWDRRRPELPVGEPERSEEFQQDLSRLTANVHDLQRQLSDAETTLADTRRKIFEDGEIAVIHAEQGSLSPDGDHVVFATERPESSPIKIRNLDTSEEEVLCPFARGPVISPSNSRMIAMYVTPPHHEKREIVLFNLEDESVRSIGRGISPTWSFDGSKLYYFDEVLSTVMSISTLEIPSEAVPLFDNMPGEFPFPTVSPDGNRIAFFDDGKLQVVDVATRHPVLSRFIHENAAGVSFGWAPDGRHIGYGCFSQGEWGLWIVDIETGDAYMAIAGWATGPNWSSDGTRMCYHLGDELHVVDWSWEQQRILAAIYGKTRQLRQQLAEEAAQLVEIRDRERQWRVNNVGITMIRLPAGQFKDELGENVEVEEFLLSDREISAGFFQAFIDDPDYPVDEKSTTWKELNGAYSPTKNHPAPRVSWFDAVMFCNWLSHKDGLEPCYERTGERLTVHGTDEEVDDWHLVLNRIGYRLPTEAQWEYSCRAGTTTDYSFGDDTRWIDSYGVCQAEQAEPCGSRLPNRWGLFDLHGNLMEWCENFDGPEMYRYRAQRGGSWLDTAVQCRTSCPDAGDFPWNRYRYERGFRVALTPAK